MTKQRTRAPTRTPPVRSERGERMIERPQDIQDPDPEEQDPESGPAADEGAEDPSQAEG